MLNSFSPVASPTAQTLLLGSMPGKDSLKMGRYYAHKRNAFWPIMGELFGATPNLPYHRRLEILQENNIALWDVISSCIREQSSLDSAIDEDSIIVNDFNLFFQEHPLITRIFFNGIKAEQTFIRYVVKKNPALTIPPYFRLPSTSPANARMKIEEKLSCWRNALRGINPIGDLRSRQQHLKG